MLAISDCCSSDLHIEDDSTLDVVGEKMAIMKTLKIFTRRERIGFGDGKYEDD